MIQVLGRTNRMLIPGQRLAKLGTCLIFAAQFHQFVKVTVHQIQPICEARVRPRLPKFRPVVELAKNKRVAQSTPANGNGMTTRLTKHAFGIGQSKHIAVTDYSDFIDGFDHTCNTRKIDCPHKTLFTGSAMNNHG